MDELQQLFALMSVTSYAEAVAVLTSVNTIVDSERTSLGTKDTAATLSALRGRSAQLSAIEVATGKQGEAALGVVHAGMSALTELPKAQERIASLEKVERTSKLAEMFDKTDKRKALTPAIRDAVTAQVDAGMSLEAADAWLTSLVPVPGLSAKPKQEAAPTGTLGEVLKHKGKTFAEMSGTERAELFAESRELYEAMRSSATA